MPLNFSKGYAVENAELIRQALKEEKDLEERLSGFATEEVVNFGVHPDGFEMCLWNGRLASTRRGKYGLCEKCHGNRMLYLTPPHDSYYWHGWWYCLDCRKEVGAVNPKTLKPSPELD